MQSAEIQEWVETCIDDTAAEIARMERAYQRSERIPLERLTLLCQLLIPLYSVHAVALALAKLEGSNGKGGRP